MAAALVACLMGVSSPPAAVADAGPPVSIGDPVETEITDVDATAPTAVQARELPVESDDVVLASATVTGFATAGVVWDGPSDPLGVTVSVRTASDGTWNDWEPLDIEPGLDDATTGGTAPIVIGKVDEVEAKVVGAGAAGITNVRLAVVDPGTGLVDARAALPAYSSPGTAATVRGGASAVSTARSALTQVTLPSAPPVFTRADWGADERLMTWTTRQGSFRGAVIHHTAGTNNYSTGDVPAILRGIYSYHAVTRGWGDIGYNFLVDRFGRIWEGRAGGIDRQTIGGHAVGWNTNTVGVSVLGNFETATVSNEAVDAIVRLLGWKFWRLGVRADGTMSVNGVTSSTIVGHRDVAATACPGASLYTRLGEIRTRVAAETARIIAAQRPAVGDSLGMRRGNRYFLSNRTVGGDAEIELSFGRAQDEVFVGDWNGDGKDTLAIRRGPRFYLSNTFAGGNAEIELTFGRAGDVVVVGDWDGDGVDTLGIRRGNRYFLSNTFAGGNAEIELTFGRAGDVVVVGDWNGNGVDTLGVRRGNRYFLSNTFAGGNAETELTFGRADDFVLVGDWNNDRKDTLAVRRGNRYFLSDTFTGGNAETEFTLGRADDVVLVGNWDGR